MVESRREPGDERDFRSTLTENETYETDFIGSSTEDCGSWALQHWGPNTILDQDIIAIVDEQSVRDETIVFAIYLRENVGDILGNGRRPCTWYEFRVPFKKARRIRADLP